MIQSNPNIYYALKLIVEHVRETSKRNPVDEKFVSKSNVDPLKIEMKHR